MAERELHDRDKSIKAFRDYQEYPPARDVLKSQKCAVYTATVDLLTDLSKLEIGTTKPTYGMLLQRHMHDEELLKEIRDKVGQLIETAIDETHNNKTDLQTHNLVIEIRSKAMEALIINFRANRAKFQSQEPTEWESAMDSKAESFGNKLSLIMNNTVKEFGLYAFSKSDTKAADQNIRRMTVKITRPYMLAVTEAVKSALRSVEGAPSRGEAMEYLARAVKSEEAHATELATAKVGITQLQAQVGAITSAVAETSHNESDKKLKLRNLESVLKTNLVTDGNYEARKTSRESREKEIKTWLNNLIKEEQNFHPNYSIFIVEPKGNSRQKVSAILTTTLESDKFRFEQLISKARKGDMTKPSSQRYQAPDNPALNLPDFKEISSKILSLYSSKLNEQLRGMLEERRTELLRKWEADPNDTLYITRKTAKNPFKLYFEFQDPSNNLTFMRYIPGVNPFEHFDFTQEIPNPGTREKAKVDVAFARRYKPYKSKQ